MSDSGRSKRRQPTRLPRPWDSPGKNTGVGCHFLLQCMKVKSESEVVQSCLTLRDPMDCSLPGSSVHGILEFAQTHGVEWSLLKLMFIELVMPSNHLILCCSFLLLPSIFPSIRIFSNESVLCIRWPKHWSFSFSISPSNEYEGLISFRIDWFDRLSRVLSNTTVQKHPFFGAQVSLWFNFHIHT